MSRKLKQHLTHDKRCQISTILAIGISKREIARRIGVSHSTNEHTNGLVRQYFAKGTDFTKLYEKQVAKVEKTQQSTTRNS